MSVLHYMLYAVHVFTVLAKIPAFGYCVLQPDTEVAVPVTAEKVRLAIKHYSIKATSRVIVHVL
jgi:hypothetical protein